MSGIDYTLPQFKAGDIVKCTVDNIPNSSIKVTKDKEYTVYMYEAKGDVPAWVFIEDDNKRTRFINMSAFKPYFMLVDNGNS